MLAKREKISTPSGYFDERVYIDNIGVLQGLPDEFKARNQIVAGLEYFLVVHTQIRMRTGSIYLG